MLGAALQHCSSITGHNLSERLREGFESLLLKMHFLGRVADNVGLFFGNYTLVYFNVQSQIQWKLTLTGI
ncbi:hypothetical protein CW304_15965 [Bacillus sp. UFRGS-B20]|nr:hypothetical protein CW304_15965 [Bacillus sp. UFRGS-B20]